MPGKGKGKKKGKSKLSKAEKERLKREEAERKAQEKEEAKLRAEQEAREREERELQEQEERRRLVEQERARHQAEIDELHFKVQNNKENLLQLQKQRRAKEKWDRYMLCDGRPDPISKKELNTYMNLWKDETEFKEFKDVLGECELTLELIGELKQSLVEDDLTEMESESYNESIHEMYRLLESKIDEATMWLLKSPGENINPETENLQCVVKSNNFRACVWGNTAKNPRVKNVDFLTEGFMIEIPKSLVLADVGIRLLYKNYDTMSPRCSTFAPKKEKVPDLEAPVQAEITIEKPSDEKLNELDETIPPRTPDAANHLDPVREKSSSRNSARKSGKKSGKKSARKRTGKSPSRGKSPSGGKSPTRGKSASSRRSVASRKSATSRKSAASTDKKEGEDETEGEEKTAESELKMLEEDDDLLDEDVVDLRSFSPMGPTILIELLELPPQQQKVDHWLIQQVVSCDLKRLNYAAPASTNLGKSLTESQYLEQEGRLDGSEQRNASPQNGVPHAASDHQMMKPIAITLRVSTDVIFFEEPQLARWEESSCHWKIDGFLDVNYREEAKVISFKTSHFGPIAIMQDLYLNVPFQSWELRPMSLNQCMLVVIAANVDVEIEIKESKCCLRKPDDKEELHGLLGQWMSPEQLMQRTKAAGINIFPAEDAAKYVSICKKDPVLVTSLYEQLALSSSAYAYCWSKWNGVEECPEDTIVVGAVEWCRDEPPAEDDYELYMASTRICYKLGMSEYDETFSKDKAESSQMHPNLFHMLQDGGNEVAKNRIAETSYQYVDCVSQLLRGTNFLVYS